MDFTQIRETNEVPSPDWLEEGEKFAVTALDANLAPDAELPLTQLSDFYWVQANPALSIDGNWKEWLGSFATEGIEQSNLLLITKMHARAPAVVDEQSQLLDDRIVDLYRGLLLATPSGFFGPPIRMGGSRDNGRMDARSHARFEQPVMHPVIQTSVRLEDLRFASQLAIALGNLRSTREQGWRFYRVLGLYMEARTIPDHLERLHQFCRCIEGFILPDPGKTGQQFKSRTELFIGPKHHDLMGRIYDTRSAVEHLNEHKLLEPFDREARIDVLRQLAVAEHIARQCLVKILLDHRLFRAFRTVDDQATFWKMAPAERQALWGKPFDPLAALANFDTRFVSDEELGKFELG